ncbi:TBC1 domain family member 5 [Parasteatoda tepidariorum]|nr:TBC1 domain family member 5 [Parasteatoda tepidariorum]
MSVGSQILDGHLQTDVLEGTSNPYQAEWNSFFCRKFYLQHLKSLAIKGDLKACHFRSICWKIFLKCLPEDKQLWIDTIKSQRQQYEEILDKYATNPRIIDSMDINVNNPLSQAQQNPWIQYFEDTELKTTIQQDVVRTFPEIDFFHKKNIQVMMSSILFSYAREFPHVSYKQGMHEILAPILFVLKYDVEGYLEYSKENKLDLELHIMLNQNYIEHDAYFLFYQLMNSIEPWYTSSDYLYDKSIVAEPFTQKMSSSPTNCLGQHLKRIYEQLLKHHDNELFRRLEELEITPQIFGIRWLRLLFGREFSMPDLLIVWDALFADSITLDLVDYIFVGMLKAIRYLLLPCDYASCLTYLMRYPNVADVRYIIDLALHLRDPGSYNQPTGKVVNPLQLKAAKDNKFPIALKTNSIKLPKVTSYVNKANDKRPNSFSMTLRPSVVETDSGVGKSTCLVDPSNYDLTPDHNELDFVEEYYDTNMLGSLGDNSFPRTTISNVMESKSIADQVSKIINEDLQNCSTDVSNSSIREMVSLSRPHESPMKKSYLKKEKHSFKDVSLVNSLEKEISDLRLVVDCCAKQLTLHLDKLQKSMLCQELLHEDEMYLSLAGLKRVRDILKGTVCIAEVIKDDLDPYTIYDHSNTEVSQNSPDSKTEEPKDIQNSDNLVTENGSIKTNDDKDILQCSVPVAIDLDENLISDDSYRTVNGANAS